MTAVEPTRERVDTAALRSWAQAFPPVGALCDEVDALRAVVEQVRALADEWLTYPHDYGGEGSLTRQHEKDLRKLLPPEAAS